MPSASDMMREMSTPVFVESKYPTGSRSTCSCTLLRSSVMARCAAMLITCDRPNDVTACTAVASSTASASIPEQVAASLRQHAVDEHLRAGGQHEARQSVDQHQEEPHRQLPAIARDQFPRLAPDHLRAHPFLRLLRRRCAAAVGASLVFTQAS
jgi:hypothetical protein